MNRRIHHVTLPGHYDGPMREVADFEPEEAVSLNVGFGVTRAYLLKAPRRVFPPLALAFRRPSGEIEVYPPTGRLVRPYLLRLARLEAESHELEAVVRGLEARLPPEALVSGGRS